MYWCVCTCKYCLKGVVVEIFSTSPFLPTLAPLTGAHTQTANPWCNKIKIVMVIDLRFINNTLVHHPLHTLPAFSLCNNESSLCNCKYPISNLPDYKVEAHIYIYFISLLRSHNHVSFFKGNNVIQTNLAVDS